MEQNQEIYRHMICITNRHLCDRDFYEQMEWVVKKRPAAVILREKDLSEEEYEKMLFECQKRCAGRVPLYAHSHLKAARQENIFNLHLPLPLLRQYIEEKEKLTDFKKIGVSVHSVEEAMEAEELGASYVTAGHIFATDCKKGIPGRGLDFLENVCRSVSIPVYAIGGINEKNLLQVMKKGAAGGCMMSGFMKSESPIR